jgi:hypothetical protein
MFPISLVHNHLVKPTGAVGDKNTYVTDDYCLRETYFRSVIKKFEYIQNFKVLQVSRIICQYSCSRIPMLLTKIFINRCMVVRI